MQSPVIYAVSINSMDISNLKPFLSSLSQERYKRFLSYKFIDDKKRCALSEILLRYLIKKEKKLPNHLIEFSYNEYGKPFLKRNSTFHFNISHSGEWVICACDSKPLGVDIERIEVADLNIAKQFFAHYEFQQLKQAPSVKQNELFYKIWTLKESYIKADGKGLSIPLESFSFDLSQDEKIFFSCLNESIPYSFKQFTFKSNCIISLCCRGNTLPKKIEEISINKILQF